MEIVEIKEKSQYLEQWKIKKAHVLQHWAWGEVKRPTWNPTRVAFLDEKGEIIDVWQVLVKNQTPFAIRIAYLPKLRIDDINNEKLELFADFAKERLRVAFVLIEHNHTDPKIQNIPQTDYRIQPECSNVVDLKSEEDNWNNLKPKYRRNINKAIRSGVVVRFFDSGDDPFRDFFYVMQEIHANTRLVMHDKTYFEKLWTELSENGLARIAVAYLDNAVVGAYLLLNDENTTYELYGGVTSTGRESEAGYLLKWESMKMTLNKGLGFYDHWGVAPKDSLGEYQKGHELERISQFKSGFGGKDVCYPKTNVLVFNDLKYRIFQAGMLVQKLNIRLRKILKSS